MTTTYTLTDAAGGNEIVFDNYVLAADEFGVHWVITREDGWSGVPALRGSVLDPSTVSGTVPLPAVYEARGIVLAGLAKAPSVAAYWGARDRLGALTQSIINQDGTLTVENEVGERFCKVRTNGEVQLDAPVGTNSFVFQIPLTAHNPFKMSGIEKTYTKPAGAQTHVATNDGLAESHPKMTVLSAGTLKAQNTTAWGDPYLDFLSLPVGAVIDFYQRSVVSATGASLYDKRLTGSRWWTLLPGANTIEFSGTASVELSHRDTWIT